MVSTAREIFDRKIKVHIRDRIFEYPNIFISGEVQFGTTNNNISEIRIYNINAVSADLFKENNNIRVSAGYGSNTGVIIEGAIKLCEPKKEGCDVCYTLKITPKALAALDQKYIRSWAANISAAIISKDIIQDCGLLVGILEIPEKTYKHKTCVGPAKELLQEIADDCGLKFYTEGKYVFMLPIKQTYKATIEVNATTGLLETPQKVEKKEKSDTSAPTDMMDDMAGLLGDSSELPDDLGNALGAVADTTPKWRVRTFLNHEINTDVILNITSRNINGLYRVVEGKHGLDDFVTEVEVVKYEGAT